MTAEAPNRLFPPLQNRGMALFIVMAAFALLLPLCMGLARSVTTAKLDRSVQGSLHLIDDLLLAAEAPIEEWLTNSARTLVLSPESKYPAALVLDDRFASEGVSRELCIVAWDQCGLIPHSAARGVSPLRLIMPIDVTESIDLGPRERAFPGLDWYLMDGCAGPFPPTPEIERVGDAYRLRWPRSTVNRIGAWVAMQDSGAINVSTAPIPILEAALRELSLGGIDRIVAARRARGLVPVPAASANHEGNSEPGFRLTSRSDRFAFRIDARADSVRRSWWATYRLSEDKWSLEQRLVITRD